MRMPSCAGSLLALSLAGLVHSQAVITSAKGAGSSATSKALFVEINNPADANFISQEELVANVVNECGRTLLRGNIDIGEQTEIALAAGEVTQVTNGSTVDVTISQRTPEGAGPFTCDMDLTSNGNGIFGQTPLQVTQGNANGGTGDLTIQVALPADMACIGASTGNICTVRCKNAANFGGCFPVQQTDITANKNDATTIQTAQTLANVLNQVAQNQKDFPAASSGNAGATVDEQGAKIADALLGVNPNLANAAPSAPPAGTTPDAAAPPAATPTPAAGARGSVNRHSQKRAAAPARSRWARKFAA
ncbi:hypothetical protein HJFPF1_03983 [Paramyrothecium foliicola]|nr:hypothetical protein HJFPF1_03983 [Paramyrothecium foliicola]